MPLNYPNVQSLLKQLSKMPNNNNALAFYLSASSMAGFLNYVSSNSKLDFYNLESKYISYIIKLKRLYFKSNRVDSIDLKREFILRKFINKLCKRKNFIDISFVRDELKNSKNNFDLIKVISTLLYFTFLCDCFDQYKDDFNYIIDILLSNDYIQLEDSLIRDYRLLLKETNLINEL